MKFLPIALLVVGLSGCTTGEIQYESLTPDAEGKVYVEMTGALTFSPSHFEVPANTTIVFQTTGGGWHNVASDTDAWQTSGQIYSDDSFELTLDEPGEYPFHCEPHVANGMKGVVRVV